MATAPVPSTNITTATHGLSVALADASTYPLNTTTRRVAPRELVHRHEDFERHSSELFAAAGRVRVHRYAESTDQFEQNDLSSIDEFRRLVGISTNQSTITVTRPDAACTVVLLNALSSRSALYLTKSLFQEIATFYQIMPEILDFVHLFGPSEIPKDLAFSSFQHHTRFDLTPSGQTAPQASSTLFDRTGKCFEICYNLKVLGRKREGSGDYSWATRQMAIYHKFNVSQRKATWLLIKGDPSNAFELDERIKEVIDNEAPAENRTFSTLSTSFRSSLAIHKKFARWATEFWRWILRDLDTEVAEKTRMLMVESREPLPGWTRTTTKDAADKRTVYTAKNLQDMQSLVEKIRAVADAIEDNVDVLRSLAKYYAQLIDRPALQAEPDCVNYGEDFVHYLNGLSSDLQRQHRRAASLSAYTNERRQLLVQYVSAQATETQERVANSTFAVGIAAQKEAVVMRVITVVTLIFLPATFVSTFFSTDIVKYQDQGNFSDVAMYRWVEVALPLTLLTIIIAYIGYKWEKRRQFKDVGFVWDIERGSG